MTKNMSADFSRRFFFCLTEKFGTAKTVLSDFSPNEFGALKIRHQPLAKASGMKSFRTLSTG